MAVALAPAWEHPVLTYANLTGRRSGRLVRTLSGVFTGVATVRAQSAPYAAAWHRSNLAALARPGRRCWVLGDSLAIGIGASHAHAGWAGQLAGRLEASHPGTTMVNLAAIGARVRDVTTQQLPVLEQLIGVEDRVVLMVGYNDLITSPGARRALPEAMSGLLDRLPPETVVATLPVGQRPCALTNARLEAAERARRIRLAHVGALGWMPWRPHLAEDWAHPDDTGHRLLADRVEPALRLALA